MIKVKCSRCNGKGTLQEINWAWAKPSRVPCCACDGRKFVELDEELWKPAPARTEAFGPGLTHGTHCGRTTCKAARTEAAQAVLTEVDAVLETYEVSNKVVPSLAKALERLRAAELARREAGK